MEQRYDTDEVLVAFRPLVLATARRFQGRGASFEDLVQEGYCAMLELLPRRPKGKSLAGYLKSRLPARVRTAAAREWRRYNAEGETDMETIVESSQPPRVSLARVVIDETLKDHEADLVELLEQGFSQCDAAEILGVTQQAVSARLVKIRKRLRGPLGLNQGPE